MLLITSPFTSVLSCVCHVSAPRVTWVTKDGLVVFGIRKAQACRQQSRTVCANATSGVWESRKAGSQPGRL
ncbi:hypothetical protein P4O66_000221 [Electrophorus voltai]|uniref:Uncharacterized protein n=1 Tax=Electrophorus voltai TaxID=2609070 RepID=A0AAD8ZLB5_9TELE|nr:hypothetical protein P4O66_000221 [Electrophorus voltai]